MNIFQINKKGFSLPELLAVMAIMALLAALSSPLIRDYIRDAANSKAKTVLTVVAQAYKTFRADYPRADIKKTVTIRSDGLNCSMVNATSSMNEPGLLVACRYMHEITWANYKYTFYVGGNCGNGTPTTALACMVGTGKAPYGSTYSAWIDIDGVMHDSLE
ncbi:MAG: type II secretion system GspH family protein [Elusimicrobiota bacterium]|jgi:prepilin-type N-terminal cleavage/methylation domain-containing protein|nr:type II secretion system GspH family protein [Elusimicrobiota bacterium]